MSDWESEKRFAAGLAVCALGAAVLIACVGFAHYEETPQCPDTVWSPRPSDPPPAPEIKITMFNNNHAVIEDGRVRCYALCMNCDKPAIDCVVMP